MSHYIALVNYTDKGIANIKDSPNRLDKARALLREMGGEFQQVYLTMGGHDMVVIYESQTTPPRRASPCAWACSATSARPRSRPSRKRPTARSLLISEADRLRPWLAACLQRRPAAVLTNARRSAVRGGGGWTGLLLS